MRKWFVRLVVAGLVGLLVACTAFWLVLIYPRRVAHPAKKLATGALVLQHARIYTAPGEPVIADGTVVVRDGRIAAVGPVSEVAIPPDAPLLACDGCVVMAGFWNTHVHFTEQKWSMAEWRPANALQGQMQDMLTSRGFTTVVDAGSNLSDTLALRRRVESQEIAGPQILTAGAALYPPHGIPYYLRDTLPKWLLLFFPQPNTPQEAARDVQRNLDDGADLTKLFTGSYVARGKVLPMPEAIAEAAVERTHANGRLVMSHPSDLAGTRVAIESGVDILAHAPDTPEGIDDALLKSAVNKNMAMIPTLKMFATMVSRKPEYLNPIYAEVRRFHGLGGTLMFGTDVGYMRDYSTEDEFASLGMCGLTADDVLAMLTTNPATRYGVLGQTGTITAGKLADLTVLDADPANGLTNFSRVRMTIRLGRVIYQH